MIANTVRSLWAEPKVPDPPAHVRRDWAIVAVVVLAVIVEAAFGVDRSWPVVSVVAILAVLPTVFWRRTHPLAAVIVGFGTFAAIDLASIVVGVDWEGLSGGAFVLLLLYALFRWGSGRQAVVGLAFTMVPVVLSSRSDTPLDELVGGTILLLLVAAVGVSVRSQANAQARGMDQIRSRERERFARELHDTVAHHVSAIAIQAQAGRAVADTRPDAAAEALAVIEEEASRTLAEMRTMVSALRQGDEPELAPQRGVADIRRLAERPEPPGDRPEGPWIEVEILGNLDGLWRPVDAALYRLAQESITNALRHARQAKTIRVQVRGEGDNVRLTVSDDGDTGLTAGAGTGASPGYGLVGMTERAHLLGGTLDAGPSDEGGWQVLAVLPRTPGSGTAS